MKTCIVIPARYHSKRFPGKPLAMINGLSMIRRVWDKCCLSIDVDHVYIATEDDVIINHCSEFTNNIIMTSSSCCTGTDRVFEASEKLDYDNFVNVQGDEPLVLSDDISKIIKLINNDNSLVYCGFCKIIDSKQFCNPNVPKVVLSSNNDIIYISRSPVPMDKNHNLLNSLQCAYRQVCIYGFNRHTLNVFGMNKRSNMEMIEDIELLRILDRGYKIKGVEMSYSVAVDVIEDIDVVEEIIRQSSF